LSELISVVLSCVRVSDPVTYIDSSTPPFLLFHGTDDRFVSPSQTLTLHNALRAAGVDSRERA
jgi:dipeptidyl aminopeptidase/acylaminoacyl peptidase